MNRKQIICMWLGIAAFVLVGVLLCPGIIYARAVSWQVKELVARADVIAVVTVKQLDKKNDERMIRIHHPGGYSVRHNPDYDDFMDVEFLVDKILKADNKHLHLSTLTIPALKGVGMCPEPTSFVVGARYLVFWEYEDPNQSLQSLRLISPTAGAVRLEGDKTFVKPRLLDSYPPQYPQYREFNEPELLKRVQELISETKLALPAELEKELAKIAFYPGEPVLLTLNIKNSGTQEEKVNFGMDGIEAFSMEIRDLNGIVVAKGGKIQKWGISRVGHREVSPGKVAQKSIVLNRWCSTLLPPGQYRVVCRIDRPGKFYFEKIKSGDQIVVVTKRHYEPMAVLELDIQIIELDRTKFKEMLEALVAFEVKPEAQSKGEWLAERDIAREMLALTESELAVPYQLQLLRTDPYTWFCPDAINSLVKSGTLEAANGLVQIIEDPSIYKEDVKHILIDGVYRLRETGKSDIINATDQFVAKYKRPVLAKPTD